MAPVFLRAMVQRSVFAAVCLGMALAVGCRPSEPTKGKPREGAETSAAPGAAQDEEKTPGDEKPTGRDILQRMVDAYRKATSYADQGRVLLQAESGSQKIVDQTIPLAVTMERPNKLRLEAYQVMLVCDGHEIHVALDSIPNQVLVRPAPAKLDMKMFRIDPSLAMSIGDFAGPPPQLLLLLSEDPMKDLLRGAEEPALIEPSQLDGRAYYRVELVRADGKSVFWIDQETMALRRIVLPTDMLRAGMPQDRPIDRLSLVMEFSEARFDRPIPAEAFAFEMPKEAEAVQLLIPPHMAQLLNKTVPVFQFADLEGKSVTPETLAGKVVVLDFWATWCGPCRETLPELQKVYERYKDNSKVAFLAVSVDQPQVKNEELAKMFKELGVQVPIARDNDQASSLFRLPGYPTMFIIDAKGIVQDCEAGGNPKLAEALPAKIEKVLAGEDIFQEPLSRYHQQLEELKQSAKALEASADASTISDSIVKEERIPEAKVNDRSEPSKLRFSPLWKCGEVKFPGNIAVVGNTKERPRLFVVDGWRAVAEVGLDGKLVARYPLDLGEKEVVGNLRTAAAADGKWYIAAFLPAQQRCHVLDENGKLVSHYPDDALKNPHSGIADVQIGDLEGDGKLKLYVSYWGVVGVQAASLEGNRLWANRSFANVACMAITGPDASGRRELLCTNATGSIGVLDAQGERHGEISVRDRILHRIVSADLLGTGELLWCGMAAIRLGENMAVGFSRKGAEVWSYPVPQGVQPQPIELIVPGKVTSEGAGQWLLPGPDGSIHILSVDGGLLDKFNYGTTLHGLATVSIEGQPVLIVASANGLEAWKVEAAGSN